MYFQLKCDSWITHAQILPDNTIKSYKKVFPKFYNSNQARLLRNACFKKQRIILKKLVTNQMCCQLTKTWEIASFQNNRRVYQAMKTSQLSEALNL